jgi:hypothetical protein
MKNERIWLLCKALVGLLILLTFTNLITPQGVYRPTFIGMPYTLWVGILEAFVLVGITWIGTKVHPGRDNLKN